MLAPAVVYPAGREPERRPRGDFAPRSNCSTLSADRKGAAVPTLSTTALTQQIDRFLASQTLGGVPDEQLIEQFTRSGDQHAFAVLMQRYGGLVLNVGRRVLRSSQDAE